MSTAHEPAYSEDGLPKDRYRLYHVEKAKGGIALTMTAGSAIVAEDSPAAFGNLHAYRDEIVPWLRRLADDCHEHGGAVMIQITHLGRRTNWNHSDWLPVLAPSPVREPAHRSFPKEAEDWDIARIVPAYAAAAARMQAAGLDGIELEAYGHLHRRLLVARDQPADRRVRRQPRQPAALHLPGAGRDPRRGRPGLHRRHPDGGRRGLGPGPLARGRARDRPPPRRARPGRLPQRDPRPHRDRRRARRGDPDPWHARGTRTSTSPARCAPRSAFRCSTPPASTTSRPRATRSPRASSTWSG